MRFLLVFGKIIAEIFKFTLRLAGKIFWLLKLLIFNRTLLVGFYKTYKLTRKNLTANDNQESSHELPAQNSSLKILNLFAKKQIVHIILVLIAFLVAANNIQAQSQIDVEGGPTDSVIFNLLGANVEEEIITEEGIPDTFINTPATYWPSETAVKAQPQMRPETEAEREDLTKSQLSTSEGTAALIQPTPSTTIATPRKRTKVIEYVVKEGDTISGIAQNFGINVNTILWENDLSAYSLIRPGQTLSVLPVSGLRHKVASGENIQSIAKKYQAQEEDVIEENKLADASQIKVGQYLIIPGGRKPAPIRTDYTYTSSQSLLSKLFSAPPEGVIVDEKAGQGHKFPWGYCTWYVAQKRYIPWRGHAKNWIANAEKMGYRIGKDPIAGAIIATKENRWYGHVAYVEKVSGNKVSFSEMNYKGVGVLTYRTLDKNDFRIIGYIY